MTTIPDTSTAPGTSPAATTSTHTSTSASARDVELIIGGMTCASCAARVEKKLNKLDGVAATVNYATEKARVQAPVGVSVEDLIDTVEATGYTVTLPTPPTTPGAAGATGDGSSGAVPTPSQGALAEVEEVDGPGRALRQRLLVSAVLALPVLVLSMIPRTQFDNWQWLALTRPCPANDTASVFGSR